MSMQAILTGLIGVVEKLCTAIPAGFGSIAELEALKHAAALGEVESRLSALEWAVANLHEDLRHAPALAAAPKAVAEVLEPPTSPPVVSPEDSP